MTAERSNNSEGGRVAYWNRDGVAKKFTHPINLDWLQKYLKPDARILDYGCGYGRVVASLAELGYQTAGVDQAVAMIEKARKFYPRLSFQQITPPNVPFDDASFDAAILFAVLTCNPADNEQRAILRELHRVLRPGGLLYISDFWLQTDERNLARYAQYKEPYQTYGVFEVSESVAVRHHSREWIASLLGGWEPLTTTDINVTTMNGNEALGFQWLGKKRAE